MKHLTPSPALFIALIALSALLIGCHRDEVGIRLQGKWQLQTVTRTDATIRVDTVWYNFMSESLFMYQIYHSTADSFMHRYGYRRHAADTLRLELESYAGPVATFLPHTDWSTGSRSFLLTHLTRTRLQLTDPHSRAVYTFVKFE